MRSRLNGRVISTIGCLTHLASKSGTVPCPMRPTTPRLCFQNIPTTSGNSTSRPSRCIRSGASASWLRSRCSASTPTVPTDPLDASSYKEGSPCSAAWSSGPRGDAGSVCTASSTPRPLLFARWPLGWPRWSEKFAQPPPAPCASPLEPRPFQARARPSPP